MVEIFLIVFGWWWSANGPQIIDVQTVPTSAPALLAEAQELQHSREIAERLAEVIEEVDKDDMDGIN